jgi:hypothetical protein
LIAEIRKRRPRWFDTHPTFSERLAVVASFPDIPPTAVNEPAIELLSNHQALEAELTRMLTSYVHEMSRNE